MAIATDAVIPQFTGRSGGKDFENVVLERMNHERESGRCHCGRYGVQVVILGTDRDGRPNYQPHRSLPDFEGVLAGGKQFIFDAKVCSQSKFDMQDYRLLDEAKGSKSRQLRHMIQRSDYGVITFFLIHWNARELKTKSEPAETFAFPISRTCPFWQGFLSQEVKSIRRSDCREYGLPVEWNRLSANERKYRPDVLAVINHLASETGRRIGGWDPLD